MDTKIKQIFIGGYTKSGTTFVGRSFDLLKGVYSKGEMDYFRLFYKNFNEQLIAFNRNIKLVNEEVYDGGGTIEPFKDSSVRALHQKIFYHIFFNGKAIPLDCIAAVEKTPRNLSHIGQIRNIFPQSSFICVYRDAEPVFRSMMRHMFAHRDKVFGDPLSQERQEMFAGFLKSWVANVGIIEKNRSSLHLVRYENIAADISSFLDYIQDNIFEQKMELSASIETLSKEYYLKNLPIERRENSLVQIGPSKITLSENELELIQEKCREPNSAFDF